MLRGLRMLQVMKHLLLDNDYEVEHNAKFETLSERIDEYGLTYPGEDVEASDMSSLVTELREALEDGKTALAQANRQLVLADERTEVAQRQATAAQEDAGEQRRAAEDAERRIPDPTPGLASTDAVGTAGEALAAPPMTTAEPPAGWTSPMDGEAASAPVFVEATGTNEGDESAPLTPGEDVYDPPQARPPDEPSEERSTHREGTKVWQRERANAEGVPFTTRDSADQIGVRRVIHQRAREAGVELSDSTTNGDLATELSDAVEAAAAAG